LEKRLEQKSEDNLQLNGEVESLENQIRSLKSEVGKYKNEMEAKISREMNPAKE
jgi:cell division protein FtsL